MDVKDMPGFVLLFVLVGMLLGVGVLIFAAFGDAGKVATAVTETGISVATGAATLTNDEVNSISYFGNMTMNTTHADISFGSEVNITLATGVLALNPDNFTDAVDYTAVYNYDADSATTTTMDSSITGITPIATTWLPLIVTILVLAIILTLVIRSFAQKRA